MRFAKVYFSSAQEVQKQPQLSNRISSKNKAPKQVQGFGSSGREHLVRLVSDSRSKVNLHVIQLTEQLQPLGGRYKYYLSTFKDILVAISLRAVVQKFWVVFHRPKATS